MAEFKRYHESEFEPGETVFKRADPKQRGMVLRTGFVGHLVEIETTYGKRYWHSHELLKAGDE